MHGIKKTEAVIFDWAGTTVDYGCFAPVGAFLETFRNKGIEPTIAEVRAPMGMLKREHIRTMLEMPRIRGLWQEQFGTPYTEAELDAMYTGYEAFLLGVLPRYAEPKPGVPEAVKAIRAMGIKIGSTTGYTDKMMAIVAPKAKELGYAPDFWCSPDAAGGVGRPYPYMVFENMRALNISAVQAVIKVGDTVSDILEGINAGAFSVGILEGSSELGLTQAEYEALSLEEKQKALKAVRRTYENAGAHRVLLNMGELPLLIQELSGEE